MLIRFGSFYVGLGDLVPPWTNELTRELGHIRRAIAQTKELIMAAIDDLKAAIADLASALADNNAEIEALLGKITTPGTSDADIAGAVASIRSLIADNKTEVDKAKAATSVAPTT